MQATLLFQSMILSMAVSQQSIWRISDRNVKFLETNLRAETSLKAQRKQMEVRLSLFLSFFPLPSFLSNPIYLFFVLKKSYYMATRFVTNRLFYRCFAYAILRGFLKYEVGDIFGSYFGIVSNMVCHNFQNVYLFNLRKLLHVIFLCC